jgi:hypothetical protein
MIPIYFPPLAASAMLPLPSERPELLEGRRGTDDRSIAEKIGERETRVAHYFAQYHQGRGGEAAKVWRHRPRLDGRGGAQVSVAPVIAERGPSRPNWQVLAPASSPFPSGAGTWRRYQFLRLTRSCGISRHRQRRDQPLSVPALRDCRTSSPRARATSLALRLSSLLL